jgi:hypothetical protein
MKEKKSKGHTGFVVQGGGVPLTQSKNSPIYPKRKNTA